MVEADPVSQLEHTVARTISESTRVAVGWTPDDVHVHFRDSTIVFVLDCDHMPPPGSEVADAMHRHVAEALEQALGRRVTETASRTRLSETSLLVILRLL